MTFDEHVVRGNLESWFNGLLKKDWCQNLIVIEGTNTGAVRQLALEDIRLSQPGDNLYRLMEAYLDKSEEQRDYKRFPGWAWITSAAMLALALALAVYLYLQPPFFNTLTTRQSVNLILFYLVFLLPYMAFIIAWTSRKGRRREKNLLHAPADRSKAENDLNRGMRSFIEGIILQKSINLTFAQPERDTVKIGDGANLSSRAQQSQRIITTYRPAIEIHMLRTLGAAVGIRGERGTGKSELLRSFCGSSFEDASLKQGGTIGVFVAVPAAFQPIQFLTVVAERLVERIPGYRNSEQRRTHRRLVIMWILAALGFLLLVGGVVAEAYRFHSFRITQQEIGLVAIIIGYVLFLGSMLIIGFPGFLARGRQASSSSWALRSSRRKVAREAQRLMVRLHYAETLTSQHEGSIAWGAIGLKGSGQHSMSSLPLTQAALLVEIETLTDRLAEVGYRVIVGVDEMDKLEAGKATDDFLNSVKQLFAIQSCSFLVSVSESAWVEFVRRNVDIRTALDSSLDAIEPTGRLSFPETRSLMRHREREMTDSQILLCHVLSGGLPREALRFARALAKFNSASRGGGGHMLKALAAAVLNVEVENLNQTIQSRTQNNWRPVVIDLNELDVSWTEHNYCSFAQIAKDAGFAYDGDGNRYYGAQKTEGNTFRRSVLLLGFFHIVWEVFCGSDGGVVNKWNDTEQIRKLGERLALIRWKIEFEPENTWNSMEEVASEFDFALVAGGR